MQESTTFKPNAIDFLETWQHFNQLAHESGVVKTALNKYDQPDSAWLNYYLYFNHYQVIGQTLLVYCLREMLDIAATHEFSEFDLTGYLLEPEQEYHDEAAGALRQALEEEDILQFASVRNLGELKDTFQKLVEAEGCLKVLVLPALDSEEAFRFLSHIDAALAKDKFAGEYVVMLPYVSPQQEVKWKYKIYANSGVTDLTTLEALAD